MEKIRFGGSLVTQYKNKTAAVSVEESPESPVVEDGLPMQLVMDYSTDELVVPELFAPDIADDEADDTDSPEEPIRNKRRKR